MKYFIILSLVLNITLILIGINFNNRLSEVESTQTWQYGMNDKILSSFGKLLDIVERRLK